MTTGLHALYRDVILDHSKRPRNFRMFDVATTPWGPIRSAVTG
jgi:hypothetical protein